MQNPPFLFCYPHRSFFFGGNGRWKVVRSGVPLSPFRAVAPELTAFSLDVIEGRRSAGVPAFRRWLLCSLSSPRFVPYRIIGPAEAVGSTLDTSLAVDVLLLQLQFHDTEGLNHLQTT